VRALIKYGKKHKFFLWTNSHKKLPKMPKFNAKIIHTKIPNRLLNLSMSLFRYPKVEDLIDVDIDAVFLPDLRPCPTKHKKYITIHDLSFIHFKDTFSLKSRFWHKILRVKKEISESKRIFTPSEFTKNDIKNTLKINAKKIKIIYEGGGENFAKKSQKKIEKIRKKYNLPNKFLLSLSTLEKRKNLKTLIKAFLKSSCKDLYLVLAGQKNNSIFAELNLPKNERVIFTGFIPEEDKNALYSASFAFIFPSLFEGFGLPLLEAMASGVPVLCSNTSSMPEVVGNSALLFNPLKKEDISVKIEKIYTDAELRKNLIQKGLNRAKEFSWESSAKKILECLI
jgi:glycosyltransferase involved in cell wall biosynthesis